MAATAVLILTLERRFRIRTLDILGCISILIHSYLKQKCIEVVFNDIETEGTLINTIS